MIGVRVEVDEGGVRDRLLQIRSDELPRRREEIVKSVMRDVLRETIFRNPVDTGRSRSAWVMSLQQLGGGPPPGWEGATPDAGAIGEGVSKSRLFQEQTDEITEVAATNGVSYIGALEYGTSRMSAFQMAQRSLQLVRGTLGRWAAILCGG